MGGGVSKNLRERLSLTDVVIAVTMSAIAGLAIATSAAGCIDGSPVVVVDDAGTFDFDALSPLTVGESSTQGDDAGSDAGPTYRPCEACLRGPGCGDLMTACDGDSKCTQSISCAISKGCFEFSEQPDILLCGLPCAQHAGVATQDEPAAKIIYSVLLCMESQCLATCNADKH